MLCVAMLSLVGAAACRSSAPQRPADVVLVTLDTTRADRLGVYGNPRPVSPNLDRLAAEAVVFDRAYSTSSWTLPAHASMFTGLAPTSHGAHNDRAGNADLSEQVAVEGLRFLRANRLAESHTTLAEWLAGRGYATAAFVGGPWLAPRFGALQGFAVHDADVGSVRGRTADQLTDRALAWLDGVDARDPIHLFVNYFDAHWSYEPPEGYMELARGTHPPGPLDAYDGEIRFVDDQLRRLLDGLRARGRYENALIVVTADHGELFGEHGDTGHGDWLWEELVHVPLLVRYPGSRGAGRRRDEPVSVQDVAAIVAGELGAALPESFRSVLPGGRDLLWFEVRRSELSIRMKGVAYDRDLDGVLRWPWKLISDSGGRHGLFRIDTDPSEQRDVAASKAARAADLADAAQGIRAKMPAAPPVEPALVDRETDERLRELGYVE